MKMKHSQRKTNWETVGYQTMAETRDELRAKLACGLKLQAFADELQPGMAKCKSTIAELRLRAEALAAQLYQRHHPVSDTRMIALCAVCVFMLVAFIVAFGASAVGNVMTLLKFGWDFSTCVVAGVIGTALVTVIGQQLHAKLLAKYPMLDIIVILVVSLLTVWALIDFGRGRGAMTQMLSNDKQIESFVDEPAVETPVTDVQGQAAVSETGLLNLFSDALTKLTIVADTAVGLLLGAFLALFTDDDFAGWRKLRKEKHQMAQFEHDLNKFVAMLEMAKKLCAAGIVRASHLRNPNHPPYLASLIVLLLLGSAQNMLAQDNVKRAEIVLLDVSGSMSHKVETRNLFNEMLQGVKQLLRTEPPDSRTWTLLISTDSFGGVSQTLVRGWTPSASGIFVERLEQARRQLVSSFETKAAGLSPVAAGTDIFGALARAKTLLDSDPNSTGYTKEIFLFTDGMNETSYNMPALLPTGVENMMSLARTNRLIVSLTGVRVYVFGASTANLNPDAWATIKAFWSAYFKAAGADLVTYSPEVSVFRR
jgi:hypothetical protein